MIAWEEIQSSISTLREVSGGYSAAQRGVVALPDGRTAFIKIGTDAHTKRMANREVEVYRWLNAHNYAYAPQLIVATDGALAIEDLSGWDFSPQWDEQKLDAVFRALDQLAALPEDGITLKGIDIQNGWGRLADGAPKRKMVIRYASDLGVYLTDEQIAAYAKRVAGCPEGNEIVHADARADNIAYNPKANSVKLIDWNWCCKGSRRFDDVALLIDAQLGGLDVVRYCPEKIDKTSALFMAGFWLEQCFDPVWPGGNPAVRIRQQKSAIIAYNWSKATIT